MNKKQLLITIIISTVISMIASLIGCMSLIRWANGLNLTVDNFTISDITYSRDANTYYTSYEGEARIYCKDTSQPYLLVVSLTLVSGGRAEDVGKTYTNLVIINNGVGTITTYDSGESDEITQPQYKIEVLGFRTLSK